MITRNRRMPTHDYLLIAFSAAVIVLSTWPETKPRQWVQIRDQQGTLQQYSFAEQDPTLAKLRLSLEKWARAGQETRLAVAQWRAELADQYAEKTSTQLESHQSAGRQNSKVFQAVSFQSDPPAADPDSSKSKATEEQSLREQRQHWIRLGEQARLDIAAVTELRRSRKALEVPPPILFGRMKPGQIPLFAVVASMGIGLLSAILFAVWSFLFPAIQLESKSEGVASEASPPLSQRDSELRLVVPSAWVRVRQPLGVVTRWVAMGLLAICAIGSLLI